LIAFGTEPILKYIASLGIFKTKIDSVLESRKELNFLMLKGAKDAQSEITHVRTLYENYQNSNIPLNKRKELYKQLQADYPKYFGNIAFEEKATNKTKAAYDDLTSSIIATARARAFGDKITENESKKLENKEKILTLEAKKREQEASASKNAKAKEYALDTQQRFAFERAAKNSAENAKQIQREITKINDENKQITAENERYDSEVSKLIKKGAEVGDPDPGKDYRKELDTRLSREKSLMAEITKIRTDASRKQLEGQEAELQAITDNYGLIAKRIQDFFKDPKNKGTTLSSFKIFSDLTKAETQERNAVIQKYREKDEKQREEDAKEVRSHFQELLQEFETFESKKLRILSDANTAADKLIKEGYDEEAKIAIERANEQISELEQANIKKLDSYKNLFDNLETLTKEQTLDGIKKIREELKEFKASASAKAAIFNLLDDLERKVNNPEDSAKKAKKETQELLQSLRLIATEFDNIGGSIGSLTSGLLNSAKAFVEIREGVSIIKELDANGKKKASTSEQIAAGAGIIGAALGVVNSVVGYFKGLKAAKEAAKKALNEFQQEAIRGEREYQALLRKRDVDSAARGKSTYQALVAQLEALKKQSPEIQKAYEKVFAALQGQSSVEGVGYRNGTWLRKAKTWDIMASLAGADYDRLEKLYSEGKLKDQAKVDFEALRALRDELEAAGLSVKSLQEQLSSLLTGTTAGGLADSLSQLFQNGKFAAQDFGDSFEEIMKNAIVNSFKYKVMEDAMKPFYDEFASLFLNGTPTQSDIDSLKEKYESIGLQLGDQFRELEKITGRSLTTKDSSGTGNSLAGAVSAIRSDQADLLASRIGGIQISSLEMLSIQRQQLDINRQCYQIAINSLNTYLAIERNTLRTADNTEALKDIRTDISNMNRKISGYANAAVGLFGFGS